VDAILVLAGGVSNDGKPHETVMRRLREAASVYQSQIARSGAAPAVVCNGGGTTHKPKWVDPAGYAVPEAALMARELRAMGVKSSDIYVEGYSDDTIGNAFFARVMHADVRPWTNLLVVTSSFQMARTQAIYDWVFGLLPMPTQKRAYRLEYVAVADEGALPRAVLRSRRTREASSLRNFQAGTLVRLTVLDLSDNPLRSDGAGRVDRLHEVAGGVEDDDRVARRAIRGAGVGHVDEAVAEPHAADVVEFAAGERRPDRAEHVTGGVVAGGRGRWSAR
jgi:hypothetical protein